MTSTETIRQILNNLDTLPDGEAGDDLELSLLCDLRDAVSEADAAERIAAGVRDGSLSWGDEDDKDNLPEGSAYAGRDDRGLIIVHGV